MSDKKLQKLQKTKEYQALIAARAKLIWPLALLMMGVYYIYILIIAFKPDVFAQTIGTGQITYGIAAGLGLILFSFLLTGLYVYKANKILDGLIAKTHEKMRKL